MKRLERGYYRCFYASLFHDDDYQALGGPAQHCLLTLKGTFGPTGIEICYPGGALNAQIGTPLDQIMAGLDELEEKHWIKRERTLLWVVNGLRWDPYYTAGDPKKRVSVQNHVAGLPRCDLTAEYVRYYLRLLPRPTS